MPPVYPDLEWYAAEGARNGHAGRCPYAHVNRCPRYFESVWLLSEKRITARLPKAVIETAEGKWTTHELAGISAETSPAISGGRVPNCFSNFCPEVSFDTFKLFAVTLIRIGDDPVDQRIAQELIEKDPGSKGKDWRWNWSHVEPLHYSICPLYGLLNRETPMSNITFNGPVTGNINVAGHAITSPVMSVSLSELVAKIDAANVTLAEKEAAKSKLAEFLTHPVVAAIVGGLAGRVGG